MAVPERFLLYYYYPTLISPPHFSFSRQFIFFLGISLASWHSLHIVHFKNCSIEASPSPTIHSKLQFTAQPIIHDLNQTPSSCYRIGVLSVPRHSLRIRALGSHTHTLTGGQRRPPTQTRTSHDDSAKDPSAEAIGSSIPIPDRTGKSQISIHFLVHALRAPPHDVLSPQTLTRMLRVTDRWYPESLKL